LVEGSRWSFRAFGETTTGNRPQRRPHPGRGARAIMFE
jgi:hypothetical protein